MVPHQDPTQQSDFSTDDFQDIGNLSPDTAPDNTSTCGGTTGHARPVPSTFSLLISDLTRDDLTALLQALQPANDDSGGGQRHGAYDQSASTLLDVALMITEALRTATEAARTLKNALEAEVLP